MHYRVDVIRNITEIDVKQWNSLSTTVFTSFEGIKTVEETQIIPRNSYYILIYKKDKIVAFARAYIQIDELYSTISKILLGKYQNYNPIRFNPCLLCYSLLSLIGKGIEIASNCKEEAFEILQLIETEMSITAK